MANRRPFNLAQTGFSIGPMTPPFLPPSMQQGQQQAPMGQTPDFGRQARAYALQDVLSHPIQVESGSAAEAIAEALAGGLRGRAARTERQAALEQQQAAQTRAEALAQQQADREYKGEIQDRDYRARALAGETDFRNRSLAQDQSQFEQSQATTRRGQDLSYSGSLARSNGPASRPMQLRGPDGALMTRTRQAAESARGLMGLTQEFANNLAQQDTFPGSGVQVWDPQVRNMSALAARMTGLMRPVGSGATSDFEQRLYARGAPSVDNTREANQAIIASIQKLGEIADARQFFYEDYATQNGTLNGAERAFQASPEFRALAIDPAERQSAPAEAGGPASGAVIRYDAQGRRIP